MGTGDLNGCWRRRRELVRQGEGRTVASVLTGRIGRRDFHQRIRRHRNIHVARLVRSTHRLLRRICWRERSHGTRLLFSVERMLESKINSMVDDDAAKG